MSAGPSWAFQLPTRLLNYPQACRTTHKLAAPAPLLTERIPSQARLSLSWSKGEAIGSFII
jgi:hypothetical protein